MEKTISKSLVTLIVLFLTVFSSRGATGSSSWTVNPADYRYDMSLYLNVFFTGVDTPVSLEKYEIGAFVGEECRGVAETIPGVENCLYMRIRSNANENEERISFKLKDKQTGSIRDIEGKEITFEKDKALGLPSAPERIIVVNYYNINIIAGKGGSVNIDSGRYPEGTELQITATPDEHFRFSGWSDGATNASRKIVVNKDIDLEASFEADTYILTYIIDNAVLKSVEIEFGATITPEPLPIKEGYTFSGWNNLPETMPANDVTVTGTFSKNSYKLIYTVDGETYKSIEVEFGSEITPEPAPEKEGYSFSGWNNLPQTMPANDVTVTGTFSKNSYKLTYTVDGETYKSIEVEFGSEITPEPAPEKEGYSFSGWNNLPQTMPANDVTVTGTFSKNSYKLIYTVDREAYKTIEVEFGTEITPEPAPEKEGYTFLGWSNLPQTMPANDVTVTGTFSKNSYKLIYTVDGETYKSIEVEFGSEITPEPAPEKEGYSFSGWSYLPETMPANDVTVTGTFSKNSYKLTYTVNGETYKTIEVEFGTEIIPEPAPEKEGYSFSGWNNLPQTMPANDVTVTGTFSKNSYKLTYTVDGETYKTIEVEFGSEITPEPAPEKEGYSFSGWNNLPQTMPANDVTVTSTFSKNSYKLTYTVDGETYKTIEVEFGSEITPEPAPEKEGYSFSGWSYLPETMPANDVTVTGTFSKNSYKLTYTVDGETYKSIEVEFGNEITPEPAPEKEGYTFSGWNNLPQTMPANDVTVTGTFSKNYYKLTYTVDGEAYKTIEVEFGSEITPEPAPEKEGYTFSGWSNLPETMPANDVTVTGTFSKNSYKLTYTVDGEAYKTIEVEFGSEITPEPAPEKEGYTFSGWNNLPETMPANDVTVTGIFTINTYIITYMVDDEIFLTQEVVYGTKIFPAEAPAKDGYTFSDWEGLPDTMPAKDVTTTANYTANIYKLTVYLDGEIYFEADLETGAPVEIPEPSLSSSHVFNGWDEDVPEVMPSHDVEIHGSTTIASSLSEISIDDDTPLTIYNLRGMLIFKGVTLREAYDRLPKGIYIINGRKFIIR